MSTNRENSKNLIFGAVGVNNVSHTVKKTSPVIAIHAGEKGNKAENFDAPLLDALDETLRRLFNETAIPLRKTQICRGLGLTVSDSHCNFHKFAQCGVAEFPRWLSVSYAVTHGVDINK